MRKKDTRRQAPPHATNEVSSDNEGESLRPQSSSPPPTPAPPPQQDQVTALREDLREEMKQVEQRMDQRMELMKQDILAAIAANAKAPAAPPPPAARTQHASPTPPAPPPTPAQDIFAAQATADRKKRDACETLRRLDPYEGKLSEVYTSPLDFVLAVERVTNRRLSHTQHAGSARPPAPTHDNIFHAQAPTSQATLAPSPAARTQHAGSARPPAPTQDTIFHAQAAADRKQRDALKTIRSLAPYAGPESEAYSSPFDFIQAIARITDHQHADAHLTDTSSVDTQLQPPAPLCRRPRAFPRHTRGSRPLPCSPFDRGKLLVRV